MDEDRHERYLRGFMTEIEQARYEDLVARRADLAGALQARLISGVEWDPPMAARARAMLTVRESFVDFEEPGRMAHGPRLDLLPSALTVPPPVVGEPREIIRVANALLVQAITEELDQLEVRVGERCLHVLGEAHGQHSELMRLPRRIHGPLLARLRTMAELDPVPPGEPQQGRIVFAHRGEVVGIDVLFEPAPEGEAVVLVIEREP